MAKALFRIAVVDPGDRSREALRKILVGIPEVVLENECTRYEFFPDVVTQSEPNGVIVALDAAPERAIQMIGEIAQTHPNPPILAISEQFNMLVRAHEAGARGLLNLPTTLEDMVKALRKLMPMEAATSATTIAILGSRGGVGCTSLAVNLGCTLAQNKKHRVLLIDLDLVQGDADVALDLSPPYRLDSLALDIERLDLHLLRKSLTHHATGLALLARPERLQDINLLKEDNLQRLITLAQLDCTHLILNLSKGWSPLDLRAMRMADMIFLVSQLELSSLRNAYLMLTSLITLELGDKVHVIMNRVGAQFAGDRISLSKAEEVLGRPVYWQIPNDSQAMLGSWNVGVPLVTYAPKSKGHERIAALADELSVPQTATGERQVHKSTKSSGIFRFLRQQ